MNTIKNHDDVDSNKNTTSNKQEEADDEGEKRQHHQQSPGSGSKEEEEDDDEENEEEHTNDDDDDEEDRRIISQLERDERILNNITSYLTFNNTTTTSSSSSSSIIINSHSNNGIIQHNSTAGAAAAAAAVTTAETAAGAGGAANPGRDYPGVIGSTSRRGNTTPWNYQHHQQMVQQQQQQQQGTIKTPATPGLVAISPLVTEDNIENSDYGNYYFDEDDDEDFHKMKYYQDTYDYHNENGFCDDFEGQRDDATTAKYHHKQQQQQQDEDDVRHHRHHRQREKYVMIDRQRKLASNIFAHQQPLRAYCVDAYQAAQEVQQMLLFQQQQQQQQEEMTMMQQGYRPHQQGPSHDESPETLVEPPNDGLGSHNDYVIYHRRHHQPQSQNNNNIGNNQQQRRNGHHSGGGGGGGGDGSSDEEEHDAIAVVFGIVHQILDIVPISVAGDVLGGCREVALDSSFATVRITSMTINGMAGTVLNVAGGVWHGVTSFNPIGFARFVVTRPFNMMGKTTEVVVSGIQSVATGVGSASSLALHRLSAKPSTGSLISQASGLRRLRSPAVSKKLLKKLSSLNSAATVVSYKELDDNTGGLSRQARSRVQRMMHYDVSLRPFMATVRLEDTFKRSLSTVDGSSYDGQSVASTTSTPLDTPFMCTPQSFPPTPVSRRMVLARGSRHAADVVFLARDQLRVNDGLASDNERTREMAHALTQGKRLAVFDAQDASGGIDLTCGYHVATKIGNQLYCSTRSMIPILRNCFVYFEMTVLPRQGGELLSQTTMATLSVGLSTKEMPPNTLTGAWKGSIGLCTNGQVLVAGQWTAPDPTMISFGDNATVGVLCCLDDSSAFQTWDGTVVNATVTFNIDGHIVRPPVTNVPFPSSTDESSASTNQQQQQQQQQQPSSLAGGGPTPPSFTIPLLVPAEEELYPTLTLHHPGMSVMCRFSAGDILAQSREAIGAPKRQPIFTVDGSIVFPEASE